MPNYSDNHVFVRKGEAIIVMWNHKKKTTENIFLGENVIALDEWGTKLDLVRNKEGEYLIDIDSSPVILRNCSEKIVNWMMNVKFAKGRLPSSTELHAEKLIVVNTFTNGVAGSVTVDGPKDWEIDPKLFNFGLAKDETFEFPLYIKLPASTSLGKQVIKLEFLIEDDRQYRFTLFYDYEIGLDDIQLDVTVTEVPEKDELIVEQIITNNTTPPELLDFRCSLEVQGQRRQDKYITKLGSGQEVRRMYIVKNASKLQSRVFKVRAEQVDGSRVLNYLWKEEDHQP